MGAGYLVSAVFYCCCGAITGGDFFAGTNTLELTLMFIEAKGFALNAYVAALLIGVSICGIYGIGMLVLIDKFPLGTNS